MTVNILEGLDIAVVNTNVLFWNKASWTLLENNALVVFYFFLFSRLISAKFNSQKKQRDTQRNKTNNRSRHSSVLIYWLAKVVWLSYPFLWRMRTMTQRSALRKRITQFNMASVWMVWLALVVVQLGFGAYGVIVSKFAKENKADPLIFSLIRDAGCFPVLLLAAFVSEKRIQIPSPRYVQGEGY